MILPNPQVATQFRELGDGWFDGEGTALDKSGLAWLEQLFAEEFARDLPIPTFFPTPEGNVRIEWFAGRNDVSLEVDLHDRTGYFHAMNLDSGVAEEANVNLQSQAEWAKLVATIRKLVS